MNTLPNIVLIIMDTSGAKHFQMYDYERKTTPNIEKIAEEGMLYKYCFSPSPWTLPAHASLFTGLYSSEHLCEGEIFILSNNLLTLAEILNYAGYKTFAISNNLLISRTLKFDRGFQHFYEMWRYFNSRSLDALYGEISKGNNKKEKIKILAKYMQREKDLLNSFKFLYNRLYLRYKADVLSRDSTPATLRSFRSAKKIIKQQSTDTKPFFLFINFMQTHAKFCPPRKYRNIFIKDDKNQEGRYKNEDGSMPHYAIMPFEDYYLEYQEGLYDQEILFLDSVISEIYEHLRYTKQLDNTLFIISSDHGEFFGEHGQVNHVFTTYNELIHVPLIIKYPKDFNMRGVNNDLVQLHDIFATIVDIISSPFPVPLSSVSLIASDKRELAVSQLLDVRFKIGACLIRNPHFEAKDFMQSYISVITNDLWKITRRADDIEEIYNLNNDFYETNNLSSSIEYVSKRNKLKDLIDKTETALGFKTVIPQITNRELALELYNVRAGFVF